jgi:hypothetical protein
MFIDALTASSHGLLAALDFSAERLNMVFSHTKHTHRNAYINNTIKHLNG